MDDKLTTVAIYSSDRDNLLNIMTAKQRFRDKLHELIEEKIKQLEGGNKNVQQEETNTKNRISRTNGK